MPIFASYPAFVNNATYCTPSVKFDMAFVLSFIFVCVACFFGSGDGAFVATGFHF